LHVWFLTRRIFQLVKLLTAYFMSHIYLKPRREFTVARYQLLVFYQYERSHGFFPPIFLRLLRGLFCHLELRYLYFPSSQKITPCLVDRRVCLSLPVSLTLWLSASSWTLLSCFFTMSVPSIFENFISTTYLPITSLFPTLLETAQCFSSVFKFKLFVIRNARGFETCFHRRTYRCFIKVAFDLCLVILIFMICTKFKPSLRLHVSLLCSQTSHIIFNVFSLMVYITFCIALWSKTCSFQWDPTCIFFFGTTGFCFGFIQSPDDRLVNYSESCSLYLRKKKNICCVWLKT